MMIEELAEYLRGEISRAEKQLDQMRNEIRDARQNGAYTQRLDLEMKDHELSAHLASLREDLTVLASS